jgi:excinuclease ABC subunit C
LVGFLILVDNYPEETMENPVKEQVKKIPDRPGVYIYRNASGEVIYVGKAKSLRKRVQNYFHSPRSLPFNVRYLIDEIASLEFIITDNEMEALILECNLIKKQRPKYNINLKDDKKYPFIAITINDSFPRVFFTRKIVRDGTLYFGPFTSAKAVRRTIKSIQTLFPIRNCKGPRPGKSTGAPCLNFHLERCLAPCVGEVREEEYRRMIDQVILFLKGRHQDLIQYFEKRMWDYSRQEEFEKAGRVRDQIAALRHMIEEQKISLDEEMDMDIIASAHKEDIACIELFSTRGGKMVARDHFLLEGVRGVDERIYLSSFLKLHYQETPFVPHEILVSTDIEDRELIEQWLSQERGSWVKVSIPLKGEKKRLMEMAAENAQYDLDFLAEKGKTEKESESVVLAELKEILELPRIPRRIEGYDVSTIMGQSSVGSMVVFEEGRSKKSDYKRFRIKTVDGQDDYAMLAEVIGRRFGRWLDQTSSWDSSFKKIPDLIVVDGGKGQLSVSRKRLTEMSLGNLPIIGLAKRMEEIYKVKEDRSLSLPPNSEALKLLQRVRDEAHRFALSYHRKLRDTDTIRSILDEVPGLGEKRKQLLVDRFGSFQEVAEAALEELYAVKGIPRAVAESIFRHFHRF